jgi:putative ABC transport system permease protein
LVAVYETNASQGRLKSQTAIVRVREWSAQAQSFEGFAGSYFENVTDTTGTQPERVAAMRTSERFFSVLGVAALIGRTPTLEEETAGGPAIVVLSYRMWQGRFNSDPVVIGRTVVLGGVPRTVIGVMPASFRYPTAETDAWIPAQVGASLAGLRQARFWTTFARMRLGRTLEQAQQDLAAVQAHLSQQYPATDKGWTATIFPLQQEQVGDLGRSLWLMFGAVALVLLTACGNIALLLLADAARREDDITVRFAMGASRRRIVAQHIAEGLLLALAGAATGLLIAQWGIEALRSTASAILPRADELQVDGRLIVFTLTVGVTTTILFALGPALLATRPGILARVTHSVRGGVGPYKALQRILVAGQIALAVILLVGAGLLIRSVFGLQQVSPGFNAQRVLAFRMSATWSERPDAVASRQMRTLEKLKQVPGLTAVALSTIVPATASADYTPAAFGIVGRPREETQLALVRQVSADYFRTVNIPVLQGETCRDDPQAAQTARLLVNRTFATRFFKGENPVGRSIVLRAPNQIIGVVADARERNVAEEPPAVVYTCGLMPFYPDPYFLVRVDDARPATMTMIRAALKEIEPQRAVYAATTIAAALGETTAQSRLVTILLSLFAAIALMLVVIGVYGLLAQFVTQQRREIGLRMALGAQPRQVFTQVVRHSVTLTIAGVLIGMAGAFALSRVMSSLVFQVSPRDPVTFAVAPAILGFIIGAATVLPARRAAKVDPIVALRYE